MWKTCHVKCGGERTPASIARVHGLRSGAGGSFPPRGWMVFFTCMTRLFLPLSRLWCWVVDGSFFRLPCCQVQCEGGSETPAYGDDRTGAQARSGPRAKRARLSASLVRGWIFGCLRASEKSLYIRHGPNRTVFSTISHCCLLHCQSWSGFPWLSMVLYRSNPTALAGPRYRHSPKGEKLQEGSPRRGRRRQVKHLI